MKQLANTAIIIGLITTALGACCVDSPGAYSYIAGAACIVGGIIAGAGYAARSRRDYGLGQFHQADRLDGDVEFIELEEG